ncbi:hypothetical protein B7486_58355, partial [cyanobacterium TDX16]
TVADRILGSQFLEDIAEFFILFQTMYDGFVERAEAVQRTLQDRCTTFLVVSTLEPSPAREAEYFLKALAERDLSLGGLVLNKVLPEYLLDAETGAVAERLGEQSAEVAQRLVDADGDVGEAQQVARVLGEVADSFANFRVVAQREAEQKAHLSGRSDVVVTVPYLDSDVADLAGLLDLGSRVWT